MYIGGVAYATHIIPGPQGLNKGLFIAQATAFTVLVSAPIGTILSKYVGARISLYLHAIDKEAGWKTKDSKYSHSSPYYVGNVKFRSNSITDATQGARRKTLSNDAAVDNIEMVSPSAVVDIDDGLDRYVSPDSEMDEEAEIHRSRTHTDYDGNELIEPENITTTLTRLGRALTITFVHGLPHHESHNPDAPASNHSDLNINQHQVPSHAANGIYAPLPTTTLAALNPDPHTV